MMQQNERVRSHKTMSNFENLRVTARLRTSVICDEYLPLDGILLSQAMRERYGPRDWSLPGGTDVTPEVVRHVAAPLQVCWEDGREHEYHHSFVWWYACSFAHARDGNAQWWLAEGQDHWNKRFDAGVSDLIDFRGKRGRVVIEQNRYRAYHMPIFYRVAREIVWWCVGDKTRIENLLATVTHVGKKSVQGWGRVAEWRVEPCAEDWSCWRDGTPMRALPAARFAAGTTYNRRHYGVRPSYYSKRNQMLVIVP